jgi:ribosome-associated translation inhibitor RaiA
MRINVSAGNAALIDEKRPYAEYRLFSALAPYETRIRSVEVRLTLEPLARARCLCAVTVDLRGMDRLETRARAVHAVAAIDRAADRAARLVRRRIAQDFSLKPPGFSS